MGANVSYDIPITLLSMVVAIVVVAAGLFLVRRYGVNGDTRFWPLGAGGLVTGLGIAAMHYTGMAAMRMQPGIDYDPLWFTLSIVVAVVTAGAALWIAHHLRSEGRRIRRIRLLAALVMGLAVVGMHYTGMYAMSMAHDHSASIVVGNSKELITSLHHRRRRRQRDHHLPARPHVERRGRQRGGRTARPRHATDQRTLTYSRCTSTIPSLPGATSTRR